MLINRAQMDPKLTRASLRTREWFAVILFLTIFAFLIQRACNAGPERWPEWNGAPLPKPVILVVVQLRGEIEHPGRYHFPKGTTIEEALSEAKVKETADLSKLDLKKELKKGMTIHVPRKKKRERKKDACEKE